MKYFIIFVLVLSMILFSCTSEKKSDQKQTEQSIESAQKDTDTAKWEKNADGNDQTTVAISYTPSDYPFDLNGTPVEIGGMVFTPATQWTVLEPIDGATASYFFGPLDPETDSSRMDVYFYPDKSKNSIKNLQETLFNQFALLDGRDPRTGAIQYEIISDGMTIHMLSLVGIYIITPDKSNPYKKEEKSPYRMVGAIVDAPGGFVLLKLAGPDFTARIMIEAYMPVVRSVKKT